ncbi:alpha/beta hydrolase [Nitrosomonas sp. ANs5]|uniref:alpha/beta hydrolase n=1 Tax=Nitrosomonas sp. ANs5 TaxID=3423941 RepID=UPI003D32DC88
MKRMILSLTTSLFAIWLLFSLLLYILQPIFVYFPDNAVRMKPAGFGLHHETITLTTADGVNINGWWLPHENPRATMLFLHGNAGNISHRLQKLQIYNRLGLSVLIVDYRGYGLSEGTPTEQGTYLDAEAAWAYLTQVRRIPARDIVLYGESLGGVIAARQASQVAAGALILESTFTSVKDMGKHYYPFLPVNLITRIHYPALEYIQAVASPVLVIHSPTDEIVPYAMGRRLFEAASTPKDFLEIKGDHNGGFLRSGELYTDGLDQFIQKHFDQPSNRLES